MHEEMLNRLRSSGGASSADLAREFFKFTNPDSTLAHRAVMGILGKDRRCFFDNEGLWHASPTAASATGAARDVRSIPWHAVHVLYGPAGAGKTIFHVSVWSIFPAISPRYNEWLVDPDTLPYEERLILTSASDEPFRSAAAFHRLEALASLCGQTAPLFLSWNQLAALRNDAAACSVAMSDNAVLMNLLLSAAGMPLPKPMTLAACYKALFERDCPSHCARSFGETLAQCAARLFELLLDKGITTMEDLEAAERDGAAAFDFSSKEFSMNDIENLPRKPGVYAFRTKDQKYLYIGKATDVRRRVMSYFRESDESPEKLTRLRSESYSLTTHPCGSELESLIYEYRLIRKHRPELNLQTDINERRGTFQPINDCIVLLPHAEENKGMSFWFRRSQKTLLKPFDPAFPSSQSMLVDLENFFFSSKLPALATDFPEQEITFRWLKAHADECTIVPVSRMKNAEEIFAAMKSYWKEVRHEA